MSSAKVLELIEEALEITRGSLTGESSSENVEEWDSLGQLSILAALDDHFDGKVADIEAMAEAESVAGIMELLAKHGLT